MSRFHCFQLRAHLKRRTFHYSHDNGGKPVIVLRGFLYDAANHRHVAGLQPAAQRVRQHLFGDHGHKGVGPAENGLPERHRTVDLLSVRERTRHVERRAIGTFIAPLSHRIEILERKPGRIDHAMAARTGLVLAV